MTDDDLKRELSQLHPEELLELYIEAKTGRKNFAYQLLPEHVVKAVNEIKTYIDNHNTTSMLEELPPGDDGSY